MGGSPILCTSKQFSGKKEVFPPGAANETHGGLFPTLSDKITRFDL